MTNAIRDLQRALVGLGSRHAAVVMPGFTHLQHAQPVLFAHHLLAYVEMLERDAGRLADCRRRLNWLPLGAGAIAGSTLPLDRELVARELEFEGVLANSMDAVADRDYLIEFLAALSIIAVHMSRLSEDIILWASQEFAFVELDDAFTTGSSLMPQKKNPDVAELTRGKCGRVVGALMGMLTTLKGLPLTYNRDLQEDKEGLFDAIDTVKAMLGWTPSTEAIESLAIGLGSRAPAFMETFGPLEKDGEVLVIEVDGKAAPMASEAETRRAVILWLSSPSEPPATLSGLAAPCPIPTRPVALRAFPCAALISSSRCSSGGARSGQTSGASSLRVDGVINPRHRFRQPLASCWCASISVSLRPLSICGSIPRRGHRRS